MARRKLRFGLAAVLIAALGMCSVRARKDTQGHKADTGERQGAALSRRAAISAPRRAGGLGQRTVDAAVQHAFEDFRTGFAEAVRSDPLQPKGACADLDNRDPDCLQPISDLLYSALANFSAGYRAHSPALAGAVESVGTREYLDSLTSIYMYAEDRVSRISALVLLRETPGVEAEGLPEAAYLKLDEITDPEIQLVLQPHSVLALPTASAADKVLDLARSADATGRVRDDAVRALAHPSNAGRIAELTQAVRSEGSASPVLGARGLPFALARCATACKATLIELISSGATYERFLALRALGLFAENDALVQEILGYGPMPMEEMLAELRAVAARPPALDPT
jgi:hypothetical protein